MAEAKILHQILMRGLNSFSSHKIALDWCNMVTLEKKVCKSRAWPKKMQKHTSYFHPPFEIHNIRPSTHSNDYETSLLFLLG
jgi:hypothetical protein